MMSNNLPRLGEDVQIRTVLVTRSPDATIAIIRATIGDEHFEWRGTAKTFRGDKERGLRADKADPAIGNRLALARALQNGAAQLIRQANGLTKCADDNRRHSAEAKKRQVPAKFRVNRKTTPRANSRTQRVQAAGS